MIVTDCTKKLKMLFHNIFFLILRANCPVLLLVSGLAGVHKHNITAHTIKIRLITAESIVVTRIIN